MVDVAIDVEIATVFQTSSHDPLRTQLEVASEVCGWTESAVARRRCVTTSSTAT